MLDLNTFVGSNARPRLEPVNLQDVVVKTVSECERMTEAEVTGGDFVITCDNPAWLAKSTNDKKEVSWFSNDGGDHVYMPTGKRVSVLKYMLTGNKLQMAGTHKMVFSNEEKPLNVPDQNPISLKEEKEMPNELDAIMNNAADEVNNSSAVTPMSSFDAAAPKKGASTADKEQKKAEREKLEALRKQIRDDVRNATANNQIDLSIVQAMWTKNAELIAFVAPTDKRQSIAAVKVPVKAQQRELIDTAPEDVKALFLKNPSSVPTEWIKTTYEIKGREAKPGKPLGVIMQVPAFLKDCSVMDYIKKNVITSAEQALKGNDNSTVIELCSINDFEQKLTFVGGSINESPATAPEGGKPGEIKILFGQPSSNATSSKGVLKDQGTIFSKKIVKVGQGNKTPMHDRNYFPLTTYETVDITGAMSADVVADLNRYTFDGLFTPAKNSKQVGTKHANLVPADKANITKKGDDIESAYITTGAGRVDVTVSAFYDKSLARQGVQLPLKRRNVKPDGTPGAPQFIKYNVTLEDKMTDEEYRAKSALGLEAFAHIVEAVGEELLAPAVLKEKFKRTGSGGSVSKYLNADMARDLLIAKMGGSLENYAINGFNFDN